MNSALRDLIALQDFELKIAHLQKQAADIPNQIQGFQDELQQIQSQHQERLARLKELSNRRRMLEGEVDMLRAKLSRLKDQLMSVKTNKEYTAMLHEIQMAEDHIRKEEDKILDIMEEAEGMEKYLKSSEQGMLKRTAELQESIRKANESIPALESELAKLREDKAELEARIESDLLLQYRRIAEVRKGIALAEAKDELCSMCHIRIRPQVYADLLRADTIHYCDSCSRILFCRNNI